MIVSVNEAVASSGIMTEWIYESVNHSITALILLDLSSLLPSDGSGCPRMAQNKNDTDVRLLVQFIAKQTFIRDIKDLNLN